MQNQEAFSYSYIFSGYLSILFLALGLYFIVKIVASRNKICGTIAFAGGLLVSVGAAFAAVVNHIRLAGGAESLSLISSLHLFLATGFICLAWSLWASRRRAEAITKAYAFGVPVSLIAITWAVSGYIGFYTKSGAWFYILLGVTSFANIILLLQMIYRALQYPPDWIAACSLILNVILVVLFARGEDEAIIRSGAGMLSVFANAAFAAASFRMLRRANP